MIAYILDDYNVTDKTLKSWIKKEKLTPLAKVIGKKYKLVIPEKWKKREC